METVSSLKGKVNNFTGAISNVNAAFQNSNVGTFNYVGGEQMSDKLDACIAALGQTDPEYDRKLLITYNHKPTEGTCQWILDNGVFQSWKSEEDSEQPLIWICDQPGVGKTTLAIFISEYLEESNLNTDDSWVLYYFCDRQDENRNTAASILKGFMLQLYKKQKGLATIIYSEYKIQRDALFQPHSIEALWEIFRNMVEASPVKRIFCVIDGVDQCEELKLDHFLKKLNKHFTEHAQRQARNKAESSETGRSDHPSKSQSAEATELRMIILGRENPKCIVQELKQFPRLLLENGGTQTDASDLRRFIDVKVERVSTSCAGDKTPSTETTQVISQVLDQGIDRSFLWVTLMAEKLTSMKQSQVKKYAKHLPESVEEIHIQNLLEIPSRQRAQVSTIMKWVTSAVRPVSTLELTKAVKYSLKTSFTKKALKKALILCRGLVQVQGKQVILADQSVRELLFREQSPLREYKELRDFVFERSDIHSELANTCVAYLQESANLEKSRRVRLKPGDKLKREDATFLRKHPFLEYAIAHWTFHAKQGNIEKTNYSVSFFKDDSQRRRLWWESYWISLRQTFAWKWTAPGRSSLLHLAAFFDIVPLAVHVERKGRLQELLGAEDHQGMKPINWATERSQAAMVKFLLQKGEFDDEALRQAARTGEASIITMLLENRELMLRSPRLASSKSSPSISPNPFQSFRKVTLNSIADLSKKIDKTPDEKSTPVSPEFKGYGKATSESPLHIAATCGHEEAIEAFLKAGEDFTRTTDGGWTPLHNAAWFGRVSIVNILLAAGADASAGTKEQLTPLHCAVKNSQPEVVECLLNKRVLDIEIEDQFGLTPFHMACKANDIPIMEILLDYGASIERRMRQGWTPLIWACINGQLAVAQVLLKRGADVNAKWVHISSEAGKATELCAIGLAKAYRHEEIARILEKFGASDTKPLSLVEAKILPPAGALEESYDLPQVQDIDVIDQHGMAEGGTLDADHSESLAESDDESDDGGDISDEAGPSRNQSASGFPETDVIRRQSSHHPFGLGIQEDLNSGTTNQSVQYGTSSLALAIAHAAEGHVRTTIQSTTDLDFIDQPEDKARSEPLTLSPGILTEDHSVEVKEDVLPGSQGDLQAEHQLSSDRKSFSQLEDHVEYSIPRNAINRTGGAASEHTAVSLSVAEGPVSIAGNDGDAVDDEPENPTVSTQSTEKKSPERPTHDHQENKRSSSITKDMLSFRFGRFVPKRSTIRTNSVTSDGNVAPSDGTNAINEEGIDPFAEPNSPDAGKFGHFSPKRVLSWKNESNGDIKMTASPKAEELADLLQTIEEPLEADNAELQTSEVDESRTNSVSSPTPDQAPKASRFAAKRMFSWRTSPSEKNGSTVSEVLSAPIDGDLKYSPFQALDSLGEESSKADSALSTSETPGMVERPPNAPGDHPTKRERSFPGKKAFSWKKTVEA